MLLTLLALATSSQFTIENLSGELAPRQGTVGEWATSPDGNHVIYVGDDRVPGMNEAFLAPTDGSAAPRVVSPPSPALNEKPRFSGDSQHALFRHDLFLVSQVYSVPVDGGPAVSLTQHAFGQTVLDYSVGQTQVVFSSDRASPGTFQLFATSVAGGPISGPLNPPLAGLAIGDFVVVEATDRVVFTLGNALYSAPLDGSSTGSILSSALQSPPVFEITPDMQTVVFLRDGGAGVELFSAPIDGSSSATLLSSPTPVPGGDVFDFRIAAGGLTVVFRGDQTNDGHPDLYAVPTHGGTPQRLSTMGASPGEGVLLYEVSPDASRVVFSAGLLLPEVGPEELFSVPLTGGPIEVLHGTTGPSDLVPGLWIAPDSQTVVFLTQSPAAPFGRQRTFLSVPTGGGVPTPITPTFADTFTHGEVAVGPYAFTDDGQRFLHGLTSRDVPTSFVYAARVDGVGQETMLSASYEEQPDFELLPGGGEIVTDEGGLHRVSLQQPERLAITGSSVGDVGGDIVTVKSVPGPHVLHAESIGTGVRLRSDSLEAPLETTLLDDDLPILSGVGAFGSNGIDAFFVAEIGWEFGHGLFTVPLDGSEQPLLRDVFVRTGQQDRPVLTADGSRVLYSSGRPELVTLGDDSPPLLVNVTFLNAHYPTFSPDEAWIVWGDQHGMRSAPTPTVSNTDEIVLTDAGEVYGRFLVLPDSQHIVYTQENAAKNKLFRVPIDGSAAPMILANSADIGEPQDLDFVPHVKATPDGSRIVYLTKLDGTELLAMYSVPSDGSRNPTALTPVLGPFWPLPYFEVSPDGAEVVFRAQGNGSGPIELYAVPVDGSAPARRLSGPVIPTGGVRAFDDGDLNREDPVFFFVDDRVVYRADAAIEGMVELFSVPLDGSQPPTTLNAPLPPGGSVTEDVALQPGGSIIAYRADQEVDERFELYAVDASGGPPVKRSGPLVPGGSVEPGILWRSPRTLLYRADQDQLDVIELYRSHEPRGPANAGSPGIRGTRSRSAL